MQKLTIAERLQVYTRYIGQYVVLNIDDSCLEQRLEKLTGVKNSAIQLSSNGQSRWIPLYEEFELYDIKLILKPLRMLTESIKQTANSLPVQNFITQYYIQLGFDMPMFFAPDHPANCLYAKELELAIYGIPDEILAKNISVHCK